MFSGSTITATNLIHKVRLFFSSSNDLPVLLTYKLHTTILGSNIDSKCSSALKREKRYAMGMSSVHLATDALYQTKISIENRGICYTDVTRGKCGQSLSRNYTKEECCDNQIVQYAVAWGEGCELCSRTEGIGISTV